MDIQDILHDSGLGKDTHSIISQGKLDAILQSRPEERRALIEEAAGISKHKRRKERALKKIKSMDEHLTRARDINKEITRQLRPLERQVDRARKYKELSSRANELTLLAVDELRSLQSQWNDLESRSKEGAAELELAQYRLAKRSASSKSSRSCSRKRACLWATWASSAVICKMWSAALTPTCACSRKRATTWCRACPTCAARSRAPSISVVAWSRSSRTRAPSLRK